MQQNPYLHAAMGMSDQERFSKDKYLLNQKIMSLGSKYYIYDDNNQPLFYVDRPTFKIKAHIGIYEDDTRKRKLLTVRQDSAWALINLSFTLLDEAEQPIATFKRQGWMSLLRRMWKIYDAHGQELAEAAEDSWAKAIMRRVPILDIIGDFLRTNFIITRSGNVIGEFIRRYTLTDKYVMDFTRDPNRTFDRRIAVALAVLLDNAESR
jgi:uncharacterized protein YxjI